MSGDHGMNCYGDGTVYRGVRSKNSKAPTYTWHALAHAKGVPSLVTNVMLTGAEITDATKDIGMNAPNGRWSIARAIEAAHGIKS